MGKYVYELHRKLNGGEYEKYSDEKIRQKLLSDLQTIEDWLYGEGSNEEKNVYVHRLQKLKNLGEPIRTRYIEAKNRQHHMQDLMKSIQRITEAIEVYHTKSSVKYAHIDVNDIEKAKKILNEIQKWDDQTVNYFDELKSHEDPAVLCSHIKQKRNTLEKECWSILNKPKPKVEPPKEQSPSPPTRNANQQPTEQQPSMEID